jgi:hypothetical protein
MIGLCQEGKALPTPDEGRGVNSFRSQRGVASIGWRSRFAAQPSLFSLADRFLAAKSDVLGLLKFPSFVCIYL